MSADDRRRTIGDRGQVTIPKDLREKFGISGGDTVIVEEAGDEIVIRRDTREADLAEGYRAMAERDREVEREWEGVSREADRYL